MPLCNGESTTSEILGEEIPSASIFQNRFGDIHFFFFGFGIIKWGLSKVLGIA